MPFPFVRSAVLHAGPTVRIAGTVVFNLLCYLSIGLPLAVIPGFVHGRLGFDPVQAGLAVSIQYLATFLSRPAAGRMADTAGPKRAVLLGLAGCLGSGLLLAGAGAAAGDPAASLFLLLCSRCLLGYAESCVSTGAITWAIGLVGPDRTAQVISMNGVTSYGGIAAGAPLGLMLAGRHGLLPVGLASMGLAAIGLLLALPRRPVQPAAAAKRVAFLRILGTVAPFGLVLAAGSVGFGVVAAFVTLFYGAEGWPLRGEWGPGTALSAFGLAFIAIRLALVPQINRRGGLPVAMVSLLVEAIGLLLVWRSPAPAMAVLGCAVAGAGFSLVFPALGVLAVARAPASSRGSALGAYSVFLDIAIGCSGPLLGLLATGYGTRALFLAAAGLNVLGLAGCVRLAASLRSRVDVAG